MIRKLGIGVGGLAVYGCGVYGAMVYMKGGEAESPCACGGCVSESHRRAQFDAVSGDYDSEIGMDETVMGLTLMRRLLIRRSRGSLPPPPPHACAAPH